MFLRIEPADNKVAMEEMGVEKEVMVEQGGRVVEVEADHSILDNWLVTLISSVDVRWPNLHIKSSYNSPNQHMNNHHRFCILGQTPLHMLKVEVEAEMVVEDSVVVVKEAEVMVEGMVVEGMAPVKTGKVVVVVVVE